MLRNLWQDANEIVDLALWEDKQAGQDGPVWGAEDGEWRDA